MMTITEKIHTLVFQALEQHKDGLQWSDLLAYVHEKDPTLHPKTVNGTVWRLLEKYPKDVFKPSKGRFQLTKYKK